MTKSSYIKSVNVVKIKKLIQYKKYNEAIEYLEKLRSKKRCEEYDYLLGIIYLKQKNYYESYKLLVVSKKHSEEYYRYMATVLQNLNRVEEALNYWNKTKDYMSYTGPELILAGRANLQVENIDSAREYFEKLVEKTNEATTVWDALAKRGYWKEATFFLMEYLKDFVETEEEKKDQLVFKLGQMYLKQLDYKKAAEAVKLALEFEENLSYYETLAIIYAEDKEYKLAIDAIEKSEVLGKPNTYKMTYLLGKMYYEMEDYQTCCESFIKYPPLADLYTYDVLSNEYYINAVNAMEEEKYQLAIELYEKALYSYNGHCKLLFNKIAYAHYMLKMYQHAAAYYMLYNISPNEYLYKNNSRGYARDVVDNSEYYDILTVNENFVLYSSFSGSSFSGSPFAIFKQLYKQEKLVHFVLYNQEEDKRAEIACMDNVYYVEANSRLHRRISSQAKILITNGTFPYAFISKPDQIIINTWHGTPIKYLGFDVEEASYLLSRNVRNSFITSTHMVHPNKFTQEALNDSFKLAGTSDTVVETTGYPRQDLMIKISDKRKQDIMDYLEIDASKPVVLYAPTYRDSLLVTGSQRDLPMKEAVEQLSVNDKYNFLFKGHYFDQSMKSKTNDIDTNELLSIVDVLISDYSSIAIDYMALERPIIYFTYDLDDYRAERGFYFELETITNSMVSTVTELEAAVETQINSQQIDSKQKEAKEKYCELDDGNAAKRVIKLALETKVQRNKQKKVLVYTGHLLKLESSKDEFEKLLGKYDLTQQNVTILIDEQELKKNLEESYIDELIERGFSITFYYGQISRTAKEIFAYNAFNRYQEFYNQEHRKICYKMMRRNAIRLFARTKYDQIDILETGNNPEIMLQLAALEHTTKNLYLTKGIESRAVKSDPQIKKNMKLYCDLNPQKLI